MDNAKVNEPSDDDESIINEEQEDEQEDQEEDPEEDPEDPDDIDNELDDLSGDDEIEDKVVDDDDEVDKPVIQIFDDNDETSSVSDLESDEDDTENNYLKKIDYEMKQNILETYHGETVKKNFDEIYHLCATKRDKNNIIIDDNHKTIPILTKYERCRAMGLRVKQLNSGASPLIETKEPILDNYVIAKMELDKKILPFIIQRPIVNGYSEYWFIKDLELLY